MPATTKRVPTDRLRQYFDDFSKRYLKGDAPEVADIEVLSSDYGDQIAARGVHLTGITFDPNSNELDISTDNGDHRIYAPREVWAVTEPDGFVSAIEVVRPDDTRDIMRVTRGGQNNENARS